MALVDKVGIEKERTRFFLGFEGLYVDFFHCGGEVVVLALGAGARVDFPVDISDMVV